MALDVGEVRSLASDAGLHEIYYNEQFRVVSFASEDTDIELDLSRINVYYSTGTVGTCINKPGQGCTQLFRRNVSLSRLPAIFRDPRIHTGTGYHRRVRQRRETCAVCLVNQSQVTLRPCGHDQLCSGCADQLPRREGRLTCPMCRAECVYAPKPGNPLAEEYEAEAALVLLRNEESELKVRIQSALAVVDAAKERRVAEAYRLEAQRQREAAAAAAAAAEAAYQADLRRLEERERLARQYAAAAAAAAVEALQAEQRRRQERERRAQLQRERAARGSRFTYSLQPNSKETIDDAFDDQTLCVALNHSDGAFLVYEDGGYSHSAGMPDDLHDLLEKEKKKRRNRRRPAYVALGSGGRYYIRFTDGSSQWYGDSKTFDNNVRNGDSKGGIRSVAFGKPGSWFIMYGNGGWSHLSNCADPNDKIAARASRAGDLKCVSLGPNGEWFLAAENGRMWWGGYSDVSDLPKQITNIKDRITFMDFADNDAFIVRYE